jgi:hypothetical protein
MSHRHRHDFAGQARRFDDRGGFLWTRGAPGAALAEQTGADATFVQADVYDAAEAVGCGGFDFVFTGIRALCWLPSVSRWARVVGSLLRPSGRLFIREGHPMLWALQEGRDDGLLVIEDSYFERDEPMIFEGGGTYVSTDAVFEHNVTHEWNHGIGEIVTALLDAGMAITGLTEHDSVPWQALPRMTQIGGGEWQLTDRPWRLAHSYTMQAIKHDSR